MQRRKFFALLAVVVLLASLVPAAAFAQPPNPSKYLQDGMTVPAVDRDVAAPSQGPGTSAALGEARALAPANPAAVLYNNGPLVNCAGCGAGGADASALQTALLMSIYGFGHALSSGYRVADDFTVTDPNGWNITDIIFYAYQTGSGIASTINHVNLRIWDGPPGQGGSSIVFGDTATNRLQSTAWSNIYRVLDTDLLNTQRPVMADTTAAAVFLGPGTYWLDWQTGGTLASGPWAPPITINGQTTTGNALQYDPGAGTWNPLLDSGTATQQGLPFIINGSPGGGNFAAITLDKTVGTTPAVCAGTSTIAVPPGTTVYYCYTVTNTGNVTLNLHDLTDDQLGVLFTLQPFALAPGASVSYVTSGVVINATTTNLGTWTAYNAGPIDVATDDDTATVIVSTDNLACNAGAIGFDGGLPASWTVVDNEGTGVVWSDIPGCGESGNFTGGAGNAACASSDIAGIVEFDTELWTNPFSLSNASSATLTYLANYSNFAGLDFLDLDISTDGGATWTNLLSWNEDHGAFRSTPGEAVTVDLSPYAGAGNVLLRWHYYDPNTGDWDWYAQVDDVALDCTVSGPTVVDDSVVSYGWHVFVDVLANDSGDPPLLVDSVTQPSHGRAINYRSRVLYIPNRGYKGPDSFTYKAIDGNGNVSTQSATVNVNVY